MLFRARRAISRAWFNLNCRSILSTPPIPPGDPGITLVSMLCHPELLMYLLAAKSFCRQLGRTPQIVILNDGSLTTEDRAILSRHLLKAQIIPIADINTQGCPQGSCWERLLLISKLARNSYIVQLDSDTLTLGPIEEVNQCLSTNRSFTLLGDKSYPEVEPMREACTRLKHIASPLVQAACERTFDRLPESASLKYLRGNAGFTGFAQGSIDREKVLRFSNLMRGLVQEKWNEWGSEQVTSNLLIANAENPYPLPTPRYLSYWAHPDIPYDRAAFLHFIGPHRYAHGFYLHQAKQTIAALTL
jgi:hypothetical protein